jgi:hypothetical protein
MDRPFALVHHRSMLLPTPDEVTKNAAHVLAKWEDDCTEDWLKSLRADMMLGHTETHRNLIHEPTPAVRARVAQVARDSGWATKWVAKGSQLYLSVTPLEVSRG